MPAQTVTPPAPRHRSRATQVACHTCNRHATWKLWIRRTLTAPDGSTATIRQYSMYACRGCSCNARAGMNSRRRSSDGFVLATTLLELIPLRPQH